MFITKVDKRAVGRDSKVVALVARIEFGRYFCPAWRAIGLEDRKMWILGGNQKFPLWQGLECHNGICRTTE